MTTLTIETAKPYDVIIGKNILQNIGKVMAAEFPHSTIAVISDDIVHELYGETVNVSLKQEGFNVKNFVFANGEQSKNIHTLTNILEFLAENQLTRSDVVIALGGGVVGDITGFAAGTYLRGIAYVQVPTTFLAAIDSSVGGKTAVNLKAGKNLAGAFYQPSLVYCDYQTMKTLTPERFGDGIAEALKYGVLQNKNLFNLIAQGDLWANMEDIIITCLKIKKDLVLADELDTGQRQLLNLGHTIGHAIEKASNFTITHGHAVAIGMALIAKIAKEQGLSAEDCEEPIINALKTHNLPTTSAYTMAELMDSMAQDKKRKGDSITFVIPETIGKCILYPVKIKELQNFLTPMGG